MNHIEDDEPSFELVRDVDHCRSCGHFHDPSADCPVLAPGEGCGDYRCCQP